MKSFFGIASYRALPPPRRPEWDARPTAVVLAAPDVNKVIDSAREELGELERSRLTIQDEIDRLQMEAAKLDALIGGVVAYLSHMDKTDAVLVGFDDEIGRAMEADTRSIEQ